MHQRDSIKQGRYSDTDIIKYDEVNSTLEEIDL